MLLCGFGMSPSSDHDAFYNAAPEVFEGNACLKSDVWSLGMNLIEMAGENHPFDGRSEEEVKNAVMSGDALIPSTLSPNLADFVRRCLVKDVKDRASVDDLLKVSLVSPNNP